METDTTDTKANSGRKSVTGNPRISYVPRKDATPEGELAALTVVYRIILECYEHKKGAGTERKGEEGEEAAERSRIGEILSEERP